MGLGLGGLGGFGWVWVGRFALLLEKGLLLLFFCMCWFLNGKNGI